jgi:hypothetical protein
MSTRKHHVLNAPRAEAAPALTAGASALGFALYASMTAGFAHASPIAVDIPDVVLGNANIDIDGTGAAVYAFQRSELNPFVFQNDIIGGNATSTVAGFTVPPNTTQPKPGTYADALAANELIDSSRTYFSGNLILAGKNVGSLPPPGEFGEFFDTSGSAYAGLSFVLPDGQHFGWVELSGTGGTITLTRYGYECDPNTAIAAGAGVEGAVCSAQSVPEPGSLALLVAGAAGVLALRRRQRRVS